MRLFIAVNFNDEIKERLYQTSVELSAHALRGNFTQRENFHLTLVFIGETSEVNSVKHAMDKIISAPVDINIKKLGRFRRDGGDIYWAGIEKNPVLNKLYDQLVSELIESGFPLERREYKPHLTLGRQVVMERGFNSENFSQSIKLISVKAEKISLMKSERINGKLTYTEIYTKMLSL